MKPNELSRSIVLSRTDESSSTMEITRFIGIPDSDIAIASPIPRFVRRGTLTDANAEIEGRLPKRAPRGQQTDGAKSREETPFGVTDTSADRSSEASTHT